MKNCMTCGKAIYDEKWGNYKCSEKKCVIRDVEHLLACSGYKKGTPKESKSNVDYEETVRDSQE